MPHSEQVDLATLADLAVQVPGVLGDLVSFLPSEGEFELRESFRVYELTFKGIHEVNMDGEPFDDKVTWSGSWHIQLFWRRDEAEEGVPAGHVRATGNGAWTIDGVFISELARKIDKTIGDLAAIPESSIVRLLIAPSHYLHALWVRESGKEDQFFALETGLERKESYAETELLTLLRAIPPSIGVGWKNPRSESELGETE